MRREDREQDFTQFYLARGPALRRTAYLMVRDWHVAEDLTQQTFIKLYAAWPRVRRGSAEAYARRAVVNTCLSHLRGRGRETPVAVPPEQTTTAREAPLDLGHALGLLPPGQRAVVALRFLDDLSVGDVAEILRISEGTVKSQSSRALTTLRDHLPDLLLCEES